jgi:hypothetical protein
MVSSGGLRWYSYMVFLDGIPIWLVPPWIQYFTNIHGGCDDFDPSTTGYHRINPERTPDSGDAFLTQTQAQKLGFRSLS